MTTGLGWFFHGPSVTLIQGTSDYSLIIFACCLALFLVYLALDMIRYSKINQIQRRYFMWGTSCALLLSTAIWSMHYIAILGDSFTPDVQITYDPLLMSVSFLLMLLPAMLCLLLFRKNIYLSSMGLGFGIAMMNFIAFKSMDSDLQKIHILFIPSLVCLSFAYAVLMAFISLSLVKQAYLKNKNILKVLSIVTMLFTILGTYLLSLSASEFSLVVIKNKLNLFFPEMVGAVILIMTTLALLIVSFLSFYRRSVNTFYIEKEFLKAVLNNLSYSVIACDLNESITFFNKNFINTHQVLVSNLIELTQYFNLYKTNNQQSMLAEEQPLRQALRGEYVRNLHLKSEIAHGKSRHLKINSQPIISPTGNIIGGLMSIEDVTEPERLESELLYQATHDAFTDLPNRNLLVNNIENAIEEKRETEKKFALLFIDIDNFKLINNNFGHSIGDALLLIVSKRLRNVIHPDDTLARIGGDEFVILANDIKDKEQILLMAKDIISSLSEPFVVNGQRILLTLSIGVTIYPDNGDRAEDLLKNADIAVHRVKERGRNSIKFFNKQMERRTAKRLELVQYLYRALENNEFFLNYQPLIDLESGYISGLETLLRWQHPTLGLVPPHEFIPLAEEIGLIIPIGQWILETACLQNKKWQNEGLPFIKIAVNVSAKQFNDSYFMDTLEKILSRTNLSPEYLELELTESVIISQPDEIIKLLRILRNVGVNIALDDFGTGYSSLSYLSQLPIDKIKIDKSFIDSIASSYETAAIVLSIISMAKSLKLKIAAEGVEDDNQLLFLRLNHCDEIQGYYFSKPLSLEECYELLLKNPKLIA